MTPLSQDATQAQWCKDLTGLDPSSASLHAQHSCFLLTTCMLLIIGPLKLFNNHNFVKTPVSSHPASSHSLALCDLRPPSFKVLLLQAIVLVKKHCYFFLLGLQLHTGKIFCFLC